MNRCHQSSGTRSDYDGVIWSGSYSGLTPNPIVPFAR